MGRINSWRIWIDAVKLWARDVCLSPSDCLCIDVATSQLRWRHKFHHLSDNPPTAAAPIENSLSGSDRFVFTDAGHNQTRELRSHRLKIAGSPDAFLQMCWWLMFGTILGRNLSTIRVPDSQTLRSGVVKRDREHVRLRYVETRGQFVCHVKPAP